MKTCVKEELSEFAISGRSRRSKAAFAAPPRSCPPMFTNHNHAEKTPLESAPSI
jgi:hypothetical protein